MGITLKQLTSAINKVKEYANNKFPIVSPNEDNAIISNENGIFVEDKQSQINEIKKDIKRSNFILVDDYDPCENIVTKDLLYYFDFLSTYSKGSSLIHDVINGEEHFKNIGANIQYKKCIFANKGYLQNDSIELSYPLTIELLMNCVNKSAGDVFFEASSPRVLIGYSDSSSALMCSGTQDVPAYVIPFSDLSNNINLITACFTSETEMEVYINGKKIETLTTATSRWNYTSTFKGIYLGRRSYSASAGSYFNAEMYRVRIYNRVLSQEQVISNYNSDMFFLKSKIEQAKLFELNVIDYANKKNGIEDTPVGHIISHMGINAPKHYLPCDGSEYNISDYPYLIQHFIDNFSSVNYFGGDGINTFSVPDLNNNINNINILYCIKYEPTYFMDINYYQALKDFGIINSSFENSNEMLKTLWEYTNNEKVSIKIKTKDLIAKTNIDLNEGYLLIEANGNEDNVQKIYLNANENNIITISDFNIDTGKSLTIKASWDGDHDSCSFSLTGIFSTFIDSVVVDTSYFEPYSDEEIIDTINQLWL